MSLRVAACCSVLLMPIERRSVLHRYLERNNQSINGNQTYIRDPTRRYRSKLDWRLFLVQDGWMSEGSRNRGQQRKAIINALHSDLISYRCLAVQIVSEIHRSDLSSSFKGTHPAQESVHQSGDGQVKKSAMSAHATCNGQDRLITTAGTCCL